MNSYQDLDVYKRSYALALKFQLLSLELPAYLQYDLADQLRRASRSIPSNIAEGYSRAQSPQDTQRFLRIALGSNDEVIFNLKFLKDARLVMQEPCNELVREYTIVGKQLYKLLQSLNSRKPATSN